MCRQKIECVIFDMDGLLIDSERIYTEVTNEVLGRYGKEMTWDIKAQLMGKTSSEAATHILSSFPDIPLTTEEYIAKTTALLNLRWPNVRPMPGAQRLVQHLHAHGVPIALATSSTREKFVTKTFHLQDTFACFGNRIVCGDDYPGLMRGKPAPDIFLMAAQEKLGLSVGSCSRACTDEEMEVRGKVLVFEDAILGFQAAKRANMFVVWVPDTRLLNVNLSTNEQPDLTLQSLDEFVPEKWGLPQYP